MEDRRKSIWQRLGLEGLAYPVPDHANTLAYSLGGITLGGMIILIVSGVLLTLYYNPSPDLANGSIRFLMTSTATGRLLRGIHFWTAQVVMLTLLLHLARVFFTGSYRAPRRATWWVGVLLLAIAVGQYFTGTVIKWDQEGWEALGHATEIGSEFGPLGAPLTPGFASNAPLLTRVYAIHISLIPLLLAILIAIHLVLIKKHELSPRPGQEQVPEKTIPFTQHLTRLFGYGLIVLGLVTILSILLPPGLGPSPVEGIELSKPAWVFLPLVPVEDKLGVLGIPLGAGLIFLGLILTPFLDRAPSNAYRPRAWLLAFGTVVMLALIGLGVYAIYAPQVSHLGM